MVELVLHPWSFVVLIDFRSEEGLDFEGKDEDSFEIAKNSIWRFLEFLNQSHPIGSEFLNGTN